MLPYEPRAKEQENGLKCKLSARLKERRTELKLTQEALAEKVGFTRVAISKIEGEKELPSLGLFIQLVKALNCSYQYLIGEEKHVTFEKKDLDNYYGIDSYSADILSLLKKHRLHFRLYLMVINSIIHSCKGINDEDILNGDILPKNKKDEYFNKGFLDNICQYLRVTCDKQYLRDHEYIRYLDEFDQFVFNEDEVANLLLPLIQSSLVEARKKFKPFRQYPKLKMKGILHGTRRRKND